MKLHYLQHVAFEDPAHILVWAKKQGIPVSSSLLYQNDPLPKVTDIDILVVMGGPMGVHDDSQYPWMAAEKALIKEAIERDIYVIGICLGAQLIAHVLGAAVKPNAYKEIGWYNVTKCENTDYAGSPVLNAFPTNFEAFHWHGDTFEIPTGSQHILKNSACKNQAFTYQEKVLALQFHLESTPHSIQRLIDNCGSELVTAPGIMKAQEMLLHIEERCMKTNMLLEQILEALIK